MAKSPSKTRTKAKAAGEPLLTCPFTGDTLEVEFNPVITMFRIVGSFYVSRWYAEKCELMYDFSVRDGVKPTFQRSYNIVVTNAEEEPQSDPCAGRGIKVDEEKLARALDNGD